MLSFIFVLLLAEEMPGGGKIWEWSNESSAFLEIGSIGVKNVLAECFLLG